MDDKAGSLLQVASGDGPSLKQGGSFRDLKQLLSDMPETDTDEELPLELRRRTYALCAKFLGGAWRSLPLEQLRLTRMTGGLSNVLFVCRLPDHHRPLHDEPDKALLRVYFNPETEAHLVAESVIFTLLSERHLGPKLYGIFNDGRLEEYIPSRPLACRELWVPQMSRKIASRLARIHQLAVPIAKDPDYICEALERWLSQLALYTDASTCHVSTNNGTCTFTIDDLNKELQIVRRCTACSTSPIVFCHNDLQEGNILLPKASPGNIRMQSVTEDTMYQPAAENTPKLVVIDFEYASYNHRAFDFANHFCEWSLDYNNPDHPGYSHWADKFPTAEQQRHFFGAYLEALGAKDPYEDEIESMITETASFVPLSHFFWGVWALLQVELSPVGFGFAEYARTRLGGYLETKRAMLRLLDKNASGQEDGALRLGIDNDRGIMLSDCRRDAA